MILTFSRQLGMEEQRILALLSQQLGIPIPQDDARASFHRHYFRVDWNEPLLYHAVLNTSRIALELLNVIISGWLTSCRKSTSEEGKHHG